jgi:hypothetical protein
MTVSKDSAMTNFPNLDEDYWTALEILADEVGSIKECVAQGVPWYPADTDRFEEAFRAWGNYHPDEPEDYFLSFPWPQAGEVPKVPAEYFKPRDEEKAKIRAFIDRHGGEDDPGLREFVDLARILIKEVH